MYLVVIFIRQMIDIQRGHKKHCTGVHIKEVIAARGTAKKCSPFRVRRCSLKREAIPAKIAPSDLRVFMIRRYSLMQVLL